MEVVLIGTMTILGDQLIFSKGADFSHLTFKEQRMMYEHLSVLFEEAADYLEGAPESDDEQNPPADAPPAPEAA